MNIDFYKNIVVKYPEEFKLFRDKIFPIVMKWEGGENYIMLQVIVVDGLYGE